MYSVAQKRLITAILPLHTTMPIIKELHNMGIFTANKSSARGSSNTSRIHDVEMEVMTVVVDSEIADEIFELIFDRGGLSKPSHGMIFESLVSMASDYLLDGSSEVQ